MSVQKEQCGKRLVLGGGADILTYREMSEKGVDLGLTHVRGMAQMVEVDETLHPEAVRAFGAQTVVAGVKRLAHLIEESGRSIHPGHVGPWLHGGE